MGPLTVTWCTVPFKNRNLSDSNSTRTQNHLVRKRTFNHWPLGWVFVYELSGSGFESGCSHLNFRFRACFKQGVPWHSGNYRVWIHSETRTWHDKNIQLKIENLELFKRSIYGTWTNFSVFPFLLLPMAKVGTCVPTTWQWSFHLISITTQHWTDL